MDVILGGLWDDTVSEGVPSYFRKLLDRLNGELPSFSDGGSGAGGLTEVGPTSLGSDISALTAETVSLSVHRSSASHNDHRGRAAPSPAKLSTRSASDGSDA